MYWSLRRSFDSACLQHFIEFLDLLSILNQCLKLRFEILLVLYRIIYIEYLALSSHRVDSRSQEIGVPWCRKCHRMTFVSGLLFQFFKLVGILIWKLCQYQFLPLNIRQSLWICKTLHHRVVVVLVQQNARMLFQISVQLNLLDFGHRVDGLSRNLAHLKTPKWVRSICTVTSWCYQCHRWDSFASDARFASCLVSRMAWFLHGASWGFVLANYNCHLNADNFAYYRGSFENCRCDFPNFTHFILDYWIHLGTYGLASCSFATSASSCWTPLHFFFLLVKHLNYRAELPWPRTACWMEKARRAPGASQRPYEQDVASSTPPI